MKSVTLVLGVILLLVLVVLVGGCNSYNKLNTAKQEVDQSWANVQNVYQRRADLIPNLVKTVEGSAAFERNTLTEVVEARQQVNNIKVDPNVAPVEPQAIQKFHEGQAALSSALSRLLVVVEQYPELKSTANFKELQTQLEGTENRIAVERRKFNHAVVEYNKRVTSMPVRLYAGMFGFQPRPYFTARDGAENAPEVSFDFNKPAR